MLVDVYGVGSPNLAVELDQDGEVIARQVLSLARPNVEDDGFEDFAEEERPLTYLDTYSEGARPAATCGCPEPFGHDETCARCGRTPPALRRR